VQSALLLIGLLVAAWGHAILHGWRGAAVLWERVDGAFPEAIRSPAPLGGSMLLTTGAMLVLGPLVAT